MLPSVSVVMAAFDAERFVGEAIESALAQDDPSELVEVLQQAWLAGDVTPEGRCLGA